MWGGDDGGGGAGSGDAMELGTGDGGRLLAFTVWAKPRALHHWLDTASPGISLWCDLGSDLYPTSFVFSCPLLQR